MSKNVKELWKNGAKLLGLDGKSIESRKHPLVAMLSTGGMVEHEFAASLAAMMMVTRSGGLLAIDSSLVHNARNLAVAGAKANHGTHLLFVDSDMKFPQHTLARLLSHDLDIVGATYPRRTPPYNLLFELLPGVERVEATQGVVEVASIPTGCLLINLRVFDKLAEPYFRLPSWSRGEVVPEALRYHCRKSIDADGVSREPHGLGEDNYFCASARAAGFKIWLDVELTAQIGHVGQQIVYAATEAVAPEPAREQA